MKDAYWFRHDSNARNDPKIVDLILDRGKAAYADWWILLEILREQDGYQLPKLRSTWALLAKEMMCSREEAESFIRALIDEFGLLEEDDEYFWSASLRQRMRAWDKAKEAGQKGAHKRWNSNGSKDGAPEPDGEPQETANEEPDREANEEPNSEPNRKDNGDPNREGNGTPIGGAMLEEETREKSRTRGEKSRGEKRRTRRLDRDGRGPPGVEKRPKKSQKKPKKRPSGAATASLSAEDLELYHSVEESFLAFQPDRRFTDFGKEGQHIKGLIVKARARSPDDPGGFLKSLLETFLGLKQGGNGFWSGQPFLPSALDSAGIFDRVLEQARTHTPMSDEEWEKLENEADFYADLFSPD